MKKPTDNLPSDEDSSARRITYEWDASSKPSTAIVEATAATTGREPTDLPPLYDYVDGDALDTLLCGGSTDRGNHVDVQFRYAGVVVTVKRDGHIAINPDTSVK